MSELKLTSADPAFKFKQVRDERLMVREGHNNALSPQSYLSPSCQGGA